MPPIPSMVEPSAITTIAFVIIVAAVGGMLLYGTHVAGQGVGEAPSVTRRWVLQTSIALVVWLAVTGVISASGVLESSGLPPRAMLFMGACNLLVAVFALSPAGRRLAHGLPIAALVGFQAFRFPLELILHQWYVEGVLPVQMTYVGRNLDIITGIAGLAAGLWLWRKGPSRPLVWAFNLLGLGLLLNVASIAILSSPVPFRMYTEGPAVLLVFHFPYGWILPMCVAPALAGHILVFRWLWHTRRR
ncbi:MAG: hypothetical protein AAF799_13945 [Myxococcota bacterium]